jgi:uncharacterized membrane protein YgdD (TMEM256/DUF423 family)
MQRIFWIAAAIFGALSVVMGAAAAHWLQGSVDAAGIARIEKAATYQMYHSLALLMLAIAAERFSGKALCIAGYLFIFGILCFSGSLYAYTFLGWHWLVFITPLGGMAWIAGWLSLLAVPFAKCERA